MVEARENYKITRAWKAWRRVPDNLCPHHINFLQLIKKSEDHPTFEDSFPPYWKKEKICCFFTWLNQYSEKWVLSLTNPTESQSSFFSFRALQGILCLSLSVQSLKIFCSNVTNYYIFASFYDCHWHLLFAHRAKKYPFSYTFYRANMRNDVGLFWKNEKWEKSVKKPCPTKWDFYCGFSNTVTVPYGTWDRNKILLSQSWALPFFV